MERNAISVVVPAFNEGLSLERVLNRLVSHVILLRETYRVEVIVVDDGSTDATPDVLRKIADAHPNVIRIVSHAVNRGLLAATRTGVFASLYDTVVVLDADLSYAPEIIEPLVVARREAGAAVAIASPYMPGGRVANVPFDRLVASRGANALLSLCVGGHIKTFTGMVRAYDRSAFCELLSRPHVGEFNAWAVSALLADGLRVVEIPAALVWPVERVMGPARISPGKLFGRVVMVVQTVRELLAARQAGRRGRAGTLVLQPQPYRPYSSNSHS
jgi:glycosyltransferase involved in cell wall biosynthesis